VSQFLHVLWLVKDKNICLVVIVLYDNLSGATVIWSIRCLE